MLDPTTDRATILKKFGLSEREAQLYVALLENPSLKAASLAKVAGIPRNRLYEVVEALEERGLVRILQGKVRRYEALPFIHFVDRHVEGLESEIDDIDQQRKFLEETFRAVERRGMTEPPAGRTEVLVGRRRVGREIDRLIEEAERSLVGHASEAAAERLLRHLRTHEEKLHDGVSMELYAHGARGAPPGRTEPPVTLKDALHWVNIPFETLALARDDAEILISTPIPDDTHMRTGRDFAILSTNAGLVRDYLRLIRAGL